MSAPWSVGRILAVVSLILALVLIFLALAVPGTATHLTLWTLILLALLAFAVVIG